VFAVQSSAPLLHCRKQRGHRSKLKNKDVAIGVRERGGPVRLVQTPDNKTDTAYQVPADHVSKDAQAIMTYESSIYNFKTPQFDNVRHERIKHKEKTMCAAMFAPTRGIRILPVQAFKHGLTGAFHEVSLKHLRRYLN
jgi:ISXO2 transposase-like protein